MKNKINYKKIFFGLATIIFATVFFAFPQQAKAIDGWTAQTNVEKLQWVAVTSSSDGTKLAAIDRDGEYIYTSTDSGITWVKRLNGPFGGNLIWASITSSSDGTKLVAVSSNNNYIYTSTDSGVTWVRRLGPRQWSAVASSSDGMKLVAAVNSTSSNGYIYTSTDGGVNWELRMTDTNRSWSAVASSSDGMKLVAAVNSTSSNGYIYTSTDGGVNWELRMTDTNRSWSAVASSSDGMKLVAVDKTYQNGYIGYIYTSTDGGDTWVERTSAGQRNWYSIASSSDGTKLAAVVYGGYIYISVDSGATWLPQTNIGTHNWTSVASSADGERVIVSNYGDSPDFGGYLYTYGTISLPNTTTMTPSAVDENTISLNAYASNDHITRGFEYGLDTSYGSITIENGLFGLGNFSANISNLTPNTLYHYRSYVTNSLGTTYSNDDTFIFEYQNWEEKTSAGSRYWRTVKSSDDGEKLIAINNDQDYVYLSNNGGNSWITQTSIGSRNWKFASVSPDGTKLAVVSYGGYIYTSTDGGDTWVERTSAGQRNWYSVASSPDGTEIVAVVYGGYIYTSTDGGDTWVERTSAGQRNWFSVISFSNGTRLLATVYAGKVYVSIDGGETWAEKTTGCYFCIGQPWLVATSSDGMNLVVTTGDNRQYIYTSSDGGVSFTQGVSFYDSLYSISSSSNGVKIVAVSNKGYVYISSDNGVTWSVVNSIDKQNWHSVFISPDGTKIVATTLNGYIYTSSDGGDNWIKQISAGIHSWNFRSGVISSPDGTKIIAMGTYSPIHIYDIPVIPLKITDFSTTTISNTQINLSWTEPDDGGSSIIGYKIERESPVGGGFSTIIGDTGNNNIVYNDIGLTPNTEYNYRVSAINAVGTGTASDPASAITLANDIIPDQFTFTDQTNINRSFVIESDTITISGINFQTSISISSCTGTNCEYSINDGAFTSLAGTVVNGDTVKVHQTSSSSYITTTDLVLDIGGVTDTFSVTTFSSYTLIYTAGENGGISGVSPQTIDYGSSGTEVTAIPDSNYHFVDWSDAVTDNPRIDINVTENISVTANFALTFPGSFTFSDQTDVSINTIIESNTITISGITDPTAISITLCDTLCAYKINSGEYTSDPGTVVNGDDVTVRQTSSSSYNTKTDLTLDIGGTTDTFSVTTEEEILPNPELPTVTTGDATLVTKTSATLNGNITNTGGADIINRGFEYGLNTSYGSDIKEENGPYQTGEYSLNISDLTCNTTYHYHAYTTNSVGISYGEDQTFKTGECDEEPEPPHRSHTRSTGTSVSMIASFYAEQLQRAIAVGVNPTPYLKALNLIYFVQ